VLRGLAFLGDAVAHIAFPGVVVAYLARADLVIGGSIAAVAGALAIGLVGQIVRWGLVPSWAKDSSIGAKLNNARAETVADKPSFRSSFTRHRCIISASGYFEWQALSRNGKAFKQPWYIRPTEENAYFAMAGLLAKWVAPDGSNLITACVITTEPNGVMTPIHDRMPVILSENDIGTWLDPGNNDEAF
jgi:putative SOS response-associated peptidase YedK